MHTPRFEGSVRPEVAEEWLTQISQDLEYLQCPYQYRAMIASHHLSGQARHWWAKVVQEAPARHRFTWEEFRQEFEAKYFRRQDREYRVAEFLMLQQGDMTISEYEAEFTRLLMYGGHLVPTEASKIQKFIAGLRPYLRRKIEIQEYPTLSRYISQLEKVERGEREKREGKTRERSPFRKCFGTCSSGKNVRSSDPRDKGKAPAVHAPPPLATRGSLICYRCDQPGHIASRCPTRTTGPPALALRPPRPPGQANRPPRPPVRTGAAPRVYALAAERLETGEIEPRSDFTVCIPTEETLAVHGILRGVPLEVCGRLLAAHIIVVPIGVFDIILGMDWLIRYQAYIDYPKRTIWFIDKFGGFEF
ncbi:PREDICTED: uncharacterized protein LOC104815204 [Tarenaya hassleriana]|uniref:uncharacterized protein LOC104815204 n=1 Tax=Tarenaya hassleriana TaxID=28532 RepID=UPI00053C6635|nr:PREDICTED: uncharacterized protein LOC104815204 [Tarenaya hassleriana]